jgi:hypothetical protein
MEILEAKRELRAAWETVPFDHKRAARAMAVLLELIDFDVTRIHKPYLVVDNACSDNKKKG